MNPCSTRMHSSRMHTSHSLTVCLSLLLGGGGLLLGGCLLGGLLPGWCLLLGGVSFFGVPPSGGGASLGCASFLGGLLLGGVPSSWGSVLGGGVSLPRGVSLAEGVSQHALRQTTPPPPVNRITHSCKNITLATTSLRPVTSMIIYTLKF